MTMISATSGHAAGWRLEQTYGRLPGALFVRVAPERVSHPRLVVFNRPLAVSLGLEAEALTGDEAAAIFSGNALPPGADPLAQAYAGHQYGHFTPLGDGRAHLLGEQVTPGGERFDIQLKGSGRTPFSRGGDGRAALGPMLREFIISEAMAALGVPTTRSLAVTATGEEVYRQEALPGAVLTRVAASHIRVGTVEWAAAQADPGVLRALVAYTLERHFPDRAVAEHPGLALLEGVLERQAALIARWQCLGFVHGVMNTDNMALSGETIDYGPCAFMDTYDPATVFSSIDRFGRYAYANQPHIAQWNLARLAEALLPLVHPDPQQALDAASAAVYRFPDRFHHHWLEGMTRKLGLADGGAGDQALVDDLLAWMHRRKIDFTNTFATLATGELRPGAGDAEFDAWHGCWLTRLGAEERPPEDAVARMRAHNPAFIPRNHLVEAALEAAFRIDDLGPMNRLLEVLARPYDHDREEPGYRAPAPGGCEPYRTFCGT
jgi:uncharacterized protein YdiU (UPF0061 family)